MTNNFYPQAINGVTQKTEVLLQLRRRRTSAIFSDSSHRQMQTHRRPTRESLIPLLQIPRRFQLVERRDGRGNFVHHLSDFGRVNRLLEVG